MGNFDDMVKDLDNPEVEVKGEMVDVPDKDTPTQEATPEVEQTETPPEPPKASEPPAPAVSFLDAGETDDGDEPETGTGTMPQSRPAGTRVPVSVLQKERQRRQEAERRLAELEEAKTQIAAGQDYAEMDLSAELKDVLESDDDFVDKKAAIEMLTRVGRRIASETRNATLRDIEQREQLKATKSQQQALSQKLRQSEADARQQLADFDAVVQAAVNTGSITRDEIAVCRRAPNPANALYRKSKEVLSVFGIAPQGAPTPPAGVQTGGVPPQNKTNNTPPADEVADDEALYADIFGPRAGG